MTPFDLIQDIADNRPSNLGEFLYVEIEVAGVKELHRVTRVETGCAPTLHTEFVEVLDA